MIKILEYNFYQNQSLQKTNKHFDIYCQLNVNLVIDRNFTNCDVQCLPTPKIIINKSFQIRCISYSSFVLKNNIED